MKPHRLFHLITTLVLATALGGCAAQEPLPATPASVPVITLDDDETLGAGSSITLIETLGDSPNWKVDSADAGRSTWSYQSTDATCIASFMQHTVTFNATDDRTGSETLLTTVSGIDPHLHDTELSDLTLRGEGEADEVVVTMLSVRDDNASMHMFGRAFMNADVALVGGIQCFVAGGEDLVDEFLDAVTLRIETA